MRQLLVDVGSAASAPGHADASLVRGLIEQAGSGWRVEPVRHDGTRYRYARRWTLDLLGRGDLLIEDAVADATAGDLFLALTEAGAASFPPAWRARGVAVHVLPAQAGAGHAERQPAAILEHASALAVPAV